MSDINLLLFGCVVSFIAVSGAYVYFRECITVEERPEKLAARPEKDVKANLRDAG